MKLFSEKLLDHEIFSSVIPWVTKIFFKKFIKLSSPPPTYLVYTP